MAYWKLVVDTLILDPETDQGANGTPCLEGHGTTDPFGSFPGEYQRSDIIAWFFEKEYTVYLATPAGLFIKEDAALEHRMVDPEGGYEDVDFLKIVPRDQVVREFEVTYEEFAPDVVASPCIGSRMALYEQRGWI
jgi:hypothetical protein